MGPERRNLHVKVLGLLFWNRAHAKRVLPGCTNVHGQEVVHCLRIRSFSIEVGKRGGDPLEALCCFLHGSLLAQNDRARFSISMDL